MTRYAFFDLDGTLLNIDTERFLRQYLGLLGRTFADVMPAEQFAREVMGATMATIADPRPDMTNQEKFMSRFLPRTGRSTEELLPRFAAFYRDVFPSLRPREDKQWPGRDLVVTALDKGWQIVLATNPVFPREAVMERMHWAGIADLPWAHVTTYENTRFCKPNPDYFSDILAGLGANGSNVLHFGNDNVEDLAAAEAGIDVVLVTDNLIDTSGAGAAGSRFAGTISEVLAWLRDKSG